MGNDQTGLIQDVFCDVFENLAFMFGEPAEKDELVNDGNHVQANMTFRGDKCGEIILMVPDAL